MRRGLAALALLAGMAGMTGMVLAAPPDGAALYRAHCAACHGEDRLGRIGPPLIPGAFTRMSRDKARRIIRDGLPATQMPAFGARLNDARIAALADYIFSPPPRRPEWGRAQIMATRWLANDYDRGATRPQHDADPLNLFVVVEKGDHHVSVMDGDSYRRLARFPTKRALHGGPKFSPDGRFVHVVSRDGWIIRYDLYTLDIVARVRAGIATRNIAISADGATLAVANYLPRNIVLLRADDLSVERIIPARGMNGATSRVAAVYQAPRRGSFIAAMRDIPELWEINADAARGELFAIRRVRLPMPLHDFFFDPAYEHVIGASRAAKGAVVVHLDSGRVVARIPLPGMPHLGSGISWTWRGRPVMATPHLGEGRVSIIAMDTWEVVKTIPTLGPGFFMRSHENTPHAWVDVFFGPHKDKMHVIDKRTLRIVATLNPAPGRTVAHVEFDRHGRHAWVSLWEPAPEGALIIYDAASLREVRRIPMNWPNGKYNVFNKITFSAGTSH